MTAPRASRPSARPGGVKGARKPPEPWLALPGLEREHVEHAAREKRDDGHYRENHDQLDDEADADVHGQSYRTGEYIEAGGGLLRDRMGGYGRAGLSPRRPRRGRPSASPSLP